MHQSRSSLTRLFVSITPGLFVLSGVTWSLSKWRHSFVTNPIFQVLQLIHGVIQLALPLLLWKLLQWVTTHTIIIQSFPEPFYHGGFLAGMPIMAIVSMTTINLNHIRKHVYCIHCPVTSATTILSPIFDDGHVHFSITFNVHLPQSIGTKKPAQWDEWGIHTTTWRIMSGSKFWCHHRLPTWCLKMHRGSRKHAAMFIWVRMCWLEPWQTC